MRHTWCNLYLHCMLFINCISETKKILVSMNIFTQQDSAGVYYSIFGFRLIQRDLRRICMSYTNKFTIKSKNELMLNVQIMCIYI